MIIIMTFRCMNQVNINNDSVGLIKDNFGSNKSLWYKAIGLYPEIKCCQPSSTTPQCSSVENTFNLGIMYIFYPHSSEKYRRGLPRCSQREEVCWDGSSLCRREALSKDRREISLWDKGGPASAPSAVPAPGPPCKDVWPSSFKSEC